MQMEIPAQPVYKPAYETKKFYPTLIISNSRKASTLVQRMTIVDGKVLNHFRIETLERLEVLPLVRVVKRFTEPGIFEFVSRGRACGHHRSREQQPAVAQRRSHRTYQLPTRMVSLPKPGPASVMPSAVGLTPLANAKSPDSLKSLPFFSLPFTVTLI